MDFDTTKRLGFGCMRLKMKDDEVDQEEFKRMIDAFMAAGFTYFDTAHGYLNGKSEAALRPCLTKRYDRASYQLANKLSEWYIKEEGDIRPFFEKQLAICGVDYFDVYLCHAVNRHNYEKYRSCRAFEILGELKNEGKIRHVAMSFHDTADVLDRILAEQPTVELVQLQINYLDHDDPGVQSRACYDVAMKHGKRVIVMEPVKGGALVNLPKEATAVLDGLHGGSYASYALRYAASLPGVVMVLSGMGSMEMMQDNLQTMDRFVPLSEKEEQALAEVREIIRRVRQIPCTSCNYCAEVCPQSIPISGVFAAYNPYLAAKKTWGEAKEELPGQGGGAADCIGCGACEQVCPQSIAIRKHLAAVAKRLK